ncbi:hypothetical protein HPB48_018078 [Haemaphysalis longicornis]|uniref:RNA-dependent RNA polymerase n=1 Tax=Haemaphysalis longicornis TaxID=44386 RepID=A0A9J6FUN9_HAELO|nr:hypothetical protein HPB48_018078 [Haemaphysalis longicornis]
MGTASRNSLSFVCLWTQKPRDDRESFVAAHKRFFEEALKGRATVSIERVQQKLPRHSCEDPLWQLHCRLSLHSSLNPNQLESLSTDIARQWCAGGVRTLHGSSGPLKWLQPDRRHGFWHGWLAMEANVKMRCVSFGTLPGDLTFFAERHTIESKFGGDGYTVDCTFKHDERVLQVFLECGRCSAAEGLYQLSMHYSNIFRVVVCDPVGGPTDIFLHVHTLPLFHKATGNVHPSVRGNRQATMDQMNFQRTLTIGCPCSSVLESRDIGGCFVMKLGFSDSHDARRTVGRLSRKCRRAWFQFAQVTTDRVGTKVDTLKEQLCSRLMPKLKFPCCYALNALLQRSDDIAVQLMLLSSEEFNSVLRNLELFAARNEGALEEALFGVGTALENHSIVTFATALPALFAQSCKTHVPCQVPRGSCLIRRLFVTPSRIFYLPPAVHSENRVLRKFDAGYALRVSFRDDHFEFLSYSLGCHPQKQEMMDKVVGSFLREGVKIGDRHFKLLASSVSQLRDHGVWLYADDPQGNTVESIREWMGDFSTLPNMAKKIARMGQCFSTTEESVTVPLHSETMEDAADIEGGTHPESGKPYVFSDGIGMISESLMEKVCSKLDLTEVPSAIQIRYAGYKGMLCMNNTLEGDKLILRKSMNKFACSTSDSLEVIKVSSPLFLGLQQNMVLQLCDAFVSNETALNILCTYTNASLPFFKMHLRGLALSREPFTRSLLLVVYKSMIAGLQEKGRIAIPPERGRNMLGVLDETGTLEYGQVFVQYTAIGVRHGDTDQNGGGDAPTSNAKVLTDLRWEQNHSFASRLTRFILGTQSEITTCTSRFLVQVLVTKCPCLHPGDVRKFEAVDVPALRHIRDCIVLPGQGAPATPQRDGRYACWISSLRWEFNCH